MYARIFTILIALSIIGCSGSQSKDVAPIDNMAAKKTGGKSKGKRLLGFAVTEGGVGFDVAFVEAQAAGIQFIEFPQQWDDIEVSPGKFKSPFLEIADAFYPATGTSVVLSINPIDTSTLRVPKHFIGKPFDDAALIRGFNRFVDFIIAGLPKTKIIAISIGNEVDGWLNDDTKKWAQYVRFVAAVKKHIRKTHPNIPVGVKTTWNALVKTRKREIAAVNKVTDAIMVTYYPLNNDFTVRPPTVVANEINQMVLAAGPKPVFLLEAGYPSGSANRSSEAQQAKFIEAMFSAWDQHAEKIQMVNFVWLYDKSKPEVNEMTKYYALKNPAFASFLATLGLKTYKGKSKQAFSVIKKCAAVRRWK